MITILPDVFYTEDELRAEGTFSAAVLRRAREQQGLRSQDLGRGKRLYKGEWLLAWLEKQGQGNEKQRQGA